MSESFTDCDLEVVSLCPTSNTPRVTEERGISTVDVVSISQNIQTVNRQDAEIQTDNEELCNNLEYDEEALLEFMRRMAPKVEEELRKRSKYFSSDYVQNILEEDEVETKKIFSLPIESVKNVNARHTCWNSYANKIAVNFSHTKHEAWCKHTSFILIYECDKNDEFKKQPTERIEMKVHNKLYLVYAIGNTFGSKKIMASRMTRKIEKLNFSYLDVSQVEGFDLKEAGNFSNGRIYWHNTYENVENNSKNYITHTDEKIMQISWVELNSSLYLVVGGSDGMLHLWITSAYVSDWKLTRRFTFKQTEETIDRGILCFEFSPLNSRQFIVALEGGILVYCDADSVPKIADESCFVVVNDFESTHVVNGICFSTFEENIFVTSSIDQRLRIYQLNEKSPVYVISIDYIPLGLKWSCLQGSIFFTCGVDGEIRFYDCRKYVEVKNFKLSDKLSSVAYSIKGMKQLVAAVDSKSISIWQTTLYIR